MTYGNFYYGKDGFLYKKSHTTGARWNPHIGRICNQPQNVFNKYTPGSGVGGTSTAIRRAATSRASHFYPKSSSSNGGCFTRLGLYSRYNTGNSTFSFNWYIPT